MKLFATWDIPDALRDALLRHLHDFNAAHPDCPFEAFEQTSPTVPMTERLREPSPPAVSQILDERRSPAPDAGPQLSPFDLAKAAIREHPDLSDRAIAKLIDRSHQTVGRARESLKDKPGAHWSNGRSGGPRGPAAPRRGPR